MLAGNVNCLIYQGWVSSTERGDIVSDTERLLIKMIGNEVLYCQNLLESHLENDLTFVFVTMDTNGWSHKVSVRVSVYTYMCVCLCVCVCVCERVRETERVKGRKREGERDVLCFNSPL